MANEIVEMVYESTMPVTRKAFISIAGDLLKPLREKGKAPESEADFILRRDAGIREAIAEGKARWSGKPNYGEELEDGKVVSVIRTNPTEFKMMIQAESNALSEARKDRVKMDKAEKSSV
jgi:hypothetical protein